MAFSESGLAASARRDLRSEVVTDIWPEELDWELALGL